MPGDHGTVLSEVHIGRHIGSIRAQRKRLNVRCTFDTSRCIISRNSVVLPLNLVFLPVELNQPSFKYNHPYRLVEIVCHDVIMKNE